MTYDLGMSPIAKALLGHSAMLMELLYGEQLEYYDRFFAVLLQTTFMWL